MGGATPGRRSAMRNALRRGAWVAALLVAAALTPTARAQGLDPVPTLTAIRLRTTATVPDRGTVTPGGYGRRSEGRAGFGLPGRGLEMSARMSARRALSA